MGCPNTRAGVKIVGKKGPIEQPRATQILTQSLITTSGVAIGVALVVPILVGTCTTKASGDLLIYLKSLLPPQPTATSPWTWKTAGTRPSLKSRRRTATGSPQVSPTFIPYTGGDDAVPPNYSVLQVLGAGSALSKVTLRQTGVCVSLSLSLSVLLHLALSK